MNLRTRLKNYFRPRLPDPGTANGETLSENDMDILLALLRALADDSTLTKSELATPPRAIASPSTRRFTQVAYREAVALLGESVRLRRPGQRWARSPRYASSCDPFRFRENDPHWRKLLRLTSENIDLLLTTPWHKTLPAVRRARPARLSTTAGGARGRRSATRTTPASPTIRRGGRPHRRQSSSAAVTLFLVAGRWLVRKIQRANRLTPDRSRRSSTKGGRQDCIAVGRGCRRWASHHFLKQPATAARSGRTRGNEFDCIIVGSGPLGSGGRVGARQGGARTSPCSRPARRPTKIASP